MQSNNTSQGQEKRPASDMTEAEWRAARIKERTAPRNAHTLTPEQWQAEKRRLGLR